MISVYLQIQVMTAELFSSSLCRLVQERLKHTSSLDQEPALTFSVLGGPSRCPRWTVSVSSVDRLSADLGAGASSTASVLYSSLSLFWCTHEEPLQQLKHCVFVLPSHNCF